MGSRYVIVKCGALVRGESMNVGVLTWDTPEGATFATPADPATPVHQRMLDDWGYVMAAFPRYVTTEIRDDVLARIAEIKTFADYQRTLDKCGPYTPFEFSDVRPATITAEDLLRQTWHFFFHER